MRTYKCVKKKIIFYGFVFILKMGKFCVYLKYTNCKRDVNINFNMQNNILDISIYFRIHFESK